MREEYKEGDRYGLSGLLKYDKKDMDIFFVTAYWRMVPGFGIASVNKPKKNEEIHTCPVGLLGSRVMWLEVDEVERNRES